MMLIIILLLLLIMECYSFQHQHQHQYQYPYRYHLNNIVLKNSKSDINVVKKRVLTDREKIRNDNNNNNDIDDKYIIKENRSTSSSPPPPSSSSSSSSSSSPSSSEQQRRIKKNKYAEFSKKALDPIEETIIYNKKKEEEAKIDYSAPIRGTTVPTLGAASLKRKEPIKFENVSSIIPSDAYTFGYVKIGTISSPHGVKGEVKLIMETDFAEERLKAGSVLYVKRPHRRSPRPIRVTNSRQQVGNVYLVSFDSVKTRLGATALKDFLVYIRQEDRPELGIDEYLIRDLVGLDCYLANADNKNEIFGPVATVDGVVPPDELCDGPSLVKLMHSMLELRKINNEEELCLIPLVPQIVLTIDLENKLLVIDNSYLYLFDYSYIEKKKIVIRGFLPAKSAYLTDKDRKELSKNSISINKLI